MTSQEQEPITETAVHLAQEAGDRLDQAVDMAKQQTASRLAAEQKHIADSLYTTAHALRQVGQQLREQEQVPVANMADRVAQQVERASGYLRRRSLSELIDDTEQIGRTHPLLFAGGALGLGLLGVRFLKSSRRQQPETAALPRPR